MLSASLSGALGSLRERSQFFFSLLPPGDGRFAFETRREFLEENGDEFLALNQALTRLAGELEGLPQKPEEVFNFVRRAQEIQVQLGLPWKSEDRNTVFWIERRAGRTGAVRTKALRHPQGEGRPAECFSAGHADRCWADPARMPVVEAGVRRADLGDAGRGRRFRIHPAAAGLEHARESVLPSHFDYESQALFYVPPDLPDPRTPHLRRRRRSAFASCWRSRAGGRSSSSPATRR
jgi:ATP-dependent DNA helicase DinG